MWCCMKLPGVSAAGRGVPQPALFPVAAPATTPPSVPGMELPSGEGILLSTPPRPPPVAPGLASDPWPPGARDVCAPAASDSTAPDGDIPELPLAPNGVEPELPAVDEPEDPVCEPGFAGSDETGPLQPTSATTARTWRPNQFCMMHPRQSLATISDGSPPAVARVEKSAQGAHRMREGVTNKEPMAIKKVGHARRLLLLTLFALAFATSLRYVGVASRNHTRVSPAAARPALRSRT